MLKVDLYNFEGKKKEAVSLPKAYDAKPNLSLFTQAIHVYEDRAHLGLARAKTRSEVAISTKKIYRQKGTGGARHGAKSAPIFVGGGVAHGPTGIKRVLRLSKSQRSKALLSALNYKISDSKVVLLSGVEKIKNTKEANNLIKNIVKDKNWKTGNNIFVAFSEKNAELLRAFRNIEGITADLYKNLNAYKVFLANGLIIDNDALGEKREMKKERSEEVKNDVKSQIETKKKASKTTKTNVKRKTGRMTKPSTAQTSLKLRQASKATEGKAKK